MKTAPSKRLVIDVPRGDHETLKSLAASSGTSIRAMVLDAIARDLERRRAALTHSTEAPRART